ncbi:MAG: amino acid adenylation domain-containing protein [Caldilineaceae bacterium]
MDDLKARLETLSPEERARLEHTLFNFAAPPPVQRIVRRAPSAQPLLSFAQQQLWLIQQVTPDYVFYNMPNALRLWGSVNLNALQAALDGICQRHEALRTCYPLVDKVPLQQLCAGRPLPIPLVDLSDLPLAERETVLQSALCTETLRPFTLAQEQPLRVTLYRLAAEEHVLLVVTHHIASDYLSREIFQREFCLLYSAACQDKAIQLPTLPIQYVDYALWQRNLSETGHWQTQIDYWQAQLAGELPILDLPTDHPRPSAPTVTGTHAGANATTLVPQALIDDLRRLSRAENVTFFTTLLTAFNILLHYYSGQEDLIVGSPFVNRTEVELEGLIGFFANPLPLRSDLSGDPTIRQLLARNQQVTIGAYDHQALPFEKLVEVIRPVREPDRPVLYQAFLRFLERPEPEYTLPGLRVSRLAVEKGIAEFDLMLDLGAVQGEFQATLQYRTDLFAAATIQRMLSHLRNILQAMVATPDQRLSQLPILSAAEREQLLCTWNQTHVAHPPTLLHEFIKAHAQSMPQQTALHYGQAQLTYKALNQAANQLAHFLRGQGVSDETLVALCLPRTPQVIIAMLAVIKAGGAFLLLEPTWPQERLATILKQGQIRFVLTNQAAAGGVAAVSAAGVPVELLDLDALEPTLQQEPSHDLHHPQAPDALAYVVYTSGSTGEPKGVMGTHQALVNYVRFYARLVDLSPSDRRLQFAAVSSELLIAEVFCTLGGGATLILRPDQAVASIEEFLRLLDHEQITITGLPVAYWHQWTQAMAAKAITPSALRVVVTGMDRVQTEPFKLWQEKIGKRIAWYNVYGPAETTCVSTYYKADSATAPTLTNVPIGRPISNVTHYVVDAQMRPVPIGVPGELYIGGLGVTRGYLNQPEQTAERFVDNPFGPGRLYRTGDFVRYLPSGDLEFIGRRDQQVKIRGYRVELGEIERTLNQHPAVQQSVVIRIELSSMDQQLVAYWVAQANVTGKANSAPGSKPDCRSI